MSDKDAEQLPVACNVIENGVDLERFQPERSIQGSGCCSLDRFVTFRISRRSASSRAGVAFAP